MISDLQKQMFIRLLATMENAGGDGGWGPLKTYQKIRTARAAWGLLEGKIGRKVSQSEVCGWMKGPVCNS